MMAAVFDMDGMEHVRKSFVDAHAPHPVEELRFGERRIRVTDRREHFVLAVGVELRQHHFSHGLGRLRAEDA